MESSIHTHSPHTYTGKCNKKATEVSLDWFKKYSADIPPAMLGNPKFSITYDYEQDQMETIRDFLKTHNEDEARIIIEKYARLIITCWRYGFSDSVFNFTINSGVDKHGEIALLDLGEISLNKEEVGADIIAKKWQTQYSYTRDISVSLRIIADGIFDTLLTKETLEQNWQLGVSS